MKDLPSNVKKRHKRTFSFTSAASLQLDDRDSWTCIQWTIVILKMFGITAIPIIIAVVHSCIPLKPVQSGFDTVNDYSWWIWWFTANFVAFQFLYISFLMYTGSAAKPTYTPFPSIGFAIISVATGDLIPRAFNKFPVPFLPTIMGPTIYFVLAAALAIRFAKRLQTQRDAMRRRIKRRRLFERIKRRANSSRRHSTSVLSRLSDVVRSRRPRKTKSSNPAQDSDDNLSRNKNHRNSDINLTFLHFQASRSGRQLLNRKGYWSNFNTVFTTSAEKDDYLSNYMETTNNHAELSQQRTQISRRIHPIRCTSQTNRHILHKRLDSIKHYQRSKDIQKHIKRSASWSAGFSRNMNRINFTKHSQHEKPFRGMTEQTEIRLHQYPPDASFSLKQTIDMVNKEIYVKEFGMDQSGSAKLQVATRQDQKIISDLNHTMNIRPNRLPPKNSKQQSNVYTTVFHPQTSGSMDISSSPIRSQERHVMHPTIQSSYQRPNNIHFNREMNESLSATTPIPNLIPQSVERQLPLPHSLHTFTSNQSSFSPARNQLSFSPGGNQTSFSPGDNQSSFSPTRNQSSFSPSRNELAFPARNELSFPPAQNQRSFLVELKRGQQNRPVDDLKQTSTMHESSNSIHQPVKYTKSIPSKLSDPHTNSDPPYIPSGSSRAISLRNLSASHLSNNRLIHHASSTRSIIKTQSSVHNDSTHHNQNYSPETRNNARNKSTLQAKSNYVLGSPLDSSSIQTRLRSQKRRSSLQSEGAIVSLEERTTQDAGNSAIIPSVPIRTTTSECSFDTLQHSQDKSNHSIPWTPDSLDHEIDNESEIILPLDSMKSVSSSRSISKSQAELRARLLKRRVFVVVGAVSVGGGFYTLCMVFIIAFVSFARRSALRQLAVGIGFEFATYIALILSTEKLFSYAIGKPGDKDNAVNVFTRPLFTFFIQYLADLFTASISPAVASYWVFAAILCGQLLIMVMMNLFWVFDATQHLVGETPASVRKHISKRVIEAFHRPQHQSSLKQIGKYICVRCCTHKSKVTPFMNSERYSKNTNVPITLVANDIENAQIEMSSIQDPANQLNTTTGDTWDEVTTDIQRDRDNITNVPVEIGASITMHTTGSLNSENGSTRDINEEDVRFYSNYPSSPILNRRYNEVTQKEREKRLWKERSGAFYAKEDPILDSATEMHQFSIKYKAVAGCAKSNKYPEWVVLRCQELFMEFFAELAANISFMVTATCYRYGPNSYYFPYHPSLTSEAEFEQGMMLSAITIGAVSIVFVLSCIAIWYKFKVNLIRCGTDMLFHTRYMVATMVLILVVLKLVDSFIVRQNYAYFYAIDE